MGAPPHLDELCFLPHDVLVFIVITRLKDIWEFLGPPHLRRWDGIHKTKKSIKAQGELALGVFTQQFADTNLSLNEDGNSGGGRVVG